MQHGTIEMHVREVTRKIKINNRDKAALWTSQLPARTGEDADSDVERSTSTNELVN